VAIDANRVPAREFLADQSSIPVASAADPG
jgi:hypothetical protein